MKWFFATRGGWAALALRLGLGIVFFPHGMQKILGVSSWHDFTDAMAQLTSHMSLLAALKAMVIQGFSATLAGMTTHMHLPAALVVLVIAAEGLGSLGLIAGFLTRLCALGIACNMIGAVAMVHWKYGMMMNWSGKQAGEGFEYHILVVAICLALMILGGGKWSADAAIAGCGREKRPEVPEPAKG